MASSRHITQQLSTQKLLISRNRWWVVLLRLRHSALLRDLTEGRCLLIASGEHGGNGLGQLRRVRWFSHSAFNHDRVSYIFFLLLKKNLNRN